MEARTVLLLHALQIPHVSAGRLLLWWGSIGGGGAPATTSASAMLHPERHILLPDASGFAGFLFRTHNYTSVPVIVVNSQEIILAASTTLPGPAPTHRFIISA